MNKLIGLPYPVLALFVFKACERFSFYAVKCNSLNYLSSEDGFMISSIDASNLLTKTHSYALFASVFIGALCDLIGQKLGLIIGSIMVILGHSLVHVHKLNVFICAVFLLNLAGGFLRSSTIAMLNKYGRNANMNKIIAIFYQTFNLGAFLGVSTFGYVALSLGWSIAFAYALTVVILGNLIGIFFNFDLYRSNSDSIVAATQAQMSLTKEENLENINLDKSIKHTNNDTDNKQSSIKKTNYMEILYGIMLYCMLHITFIIYVVFESQDMHLVPGWLNDYGTHYLGPIYITSSLISSINPLLVLTIPSFVASIRDRFKARGYFKSHFAWANIANLCFICAAICLLLVHAERYYYGFSSPICFIFYTAFVVLGEIVFYPTLLASPVNWLPESLYGTLLSLTPLINILGLCIANWICVKALSAGSMIIAASILLAMTLTAIIINIICIRLDRPIDKSKI